MKNILNYYAAIFLPVFSLQLIAANGLINSVNFTILLFTYAFIYHPFVSGYRLLSLGVIKRSELILNFIPGWNLKYFTLLFSNQS
jgi:hypothetical protein